MLQSMHRFYIEGIYNNADILTITGEDVNHIKNVLRMRQGEKITVCNCEGLDFLCEIEEITSSFVKTRVLEEKPSGTELDLKMYLFQGLPKKDKMELIIQKAVELGVYEITPVVMKRVIVKIEDKKREDKLLERWQAIAESAAKQSGRGIIPKVNRPVSYKEALKTASETEHILVPYEDASGIEGARQRLDEAAASKSVSIFIGPEGGFDPEEIRLAEEAGAKTVTLGNRILRTETAGLTVASYLMLKNEKG